MRTLVLILVLANALLFGWTRGWLDGVTGLPVNAGREPQRLNRQLHPERIEQLDKAAVAALSQSACLELGPLDGDPALAAAQAALRSANLGVDWITRSSEQAGQWVVATIRLENPDFRARKEATYRQLKLDFEPLSGLPAEQPSLVLSRHASAAEASAELLSLDKRGLKGLRVLQLQAPKVRHLLVLPQADGLLAGKLKALKDAALNGGFKPCSTATAAAVAQAAASAAALPASAAEH